MKMASDWPVMVISQQQANQFTESEQNDRLGLQQNGYSDRDLNQRGSMCRPPRVLKPVLYYIHPVNLKELSRVCQLKLPLLGMYSLAYQNVQSSLGSMEMLL